MVKRRVLVVDDTPDWRQTVAGILEDDGWEVRAVASKEEAESLAGKESFDVAVLDVRLDEQDVDNRDGLFLMHALNKKAPSTAVIILTGYADVDMVKEALQRQPGEASAPASGFLEKTQMEQLTTLVQMAFEQSSSGNERRLKDLISKGETDQVEFKASLRWSYREQRADQRLREAIARTIAGLLNSKGGVLLLGVADDGTMVGIDHDMSLLAKPNFDGYYLLLTDVIDRFIGLEYMHLLRVSFEPVNDKTVCMITVDRSPEPVFFRTEGTPFYVRTGNSTRSLDAKAQHNYIRKNFSEK